MSSETLLPEESLEFMEEIELILKDFDFVKLQAHCFKKENKEQVSENGWDLITCLMKHLKEYKVEDDLLCKFRDIFSYIGEVSIAKDLLLGILEQFDPMVEISIVQLLIPTLNTVCRKVVETNVRNHCYNLSMVFSSLVYYAESLNLPKYDNYDPLNGSKEVSEEVIIARFISDCASIGTTAFEKISEQYRRHRFEEIHMKAVTCEFMDFCVGLLERLSFLDLEATPAISQSSICGDCSTQNLPLREAEQPAVDVVEDLRLVIHTAREVNALINMLHRPWTLLCSNTWSKLIRSNRKLSNEECDRIEQARGSYLYLLFAKSIGNDSFPKIDHPQFAFMQCLPSILTLLQKTEPVVIHKGLALCRYVSNRLSPATLQSGLMSNALKNTRWHKPVQDLLNFAVNIAIRCPSKTLRQRSAQFITRFLDKFVWIDRYNLVYGLLITVEHSGVIGYLTGYIKDKLVEILQDPAPPGSFCFIEQNRFSKIIETSIRLKDGSETNLLSEYDRLMSVLNLLRFLFIRDKTNKTGIWNKKVTIEENFLKPIRTDVNLSRMHFRDELRHQSQPKKDKDVTRPEFLINGIGLPTLPLQDRKQALESAIHSFDMMETVCIRVQELIDENHSFS